MLRLPTVLTVFIPCFYDTGSIGTKGFYKYLSNYETGDRITEPFGIGTGDNQINHMEAQTYPTTGLL